MEPQETARARKRRLAGLWFLAIHEVTDRAKEVESGTLVVARDVEGAPVVEKRENILAVLQRRREQAARKAEYCRTSQRLLPIEPQ